MDGSNNFKEEFPGDNSIEKIKPGEYKFTATDSMGRKIMGSIVIPERVSEFKKLHFPIQQQAEVI